jgi:hypothetical protein
MSSADDIEALMHQQRAQQRAATMSQGQHAAQLIAEGARHARAFIDLMQRNRVAPEPIYGYRQLGGRGGQEPVIQELTYFENAWVTRFSVDPDNGQPHWIECLRPDGRAFSCSVFDLRPNEYPVRGLVANPARCALATVPGSWALYVQRRDDGSLLGFDLRDPFTRPAEYAKAAGWYLP